MRLKRELWRGHLGDFEGEYYRLKSASIYDVPDRDADLDRAP